jgi:hypothetical protein
MPIAYGITVSGSFQSNMGYPNRSLTTSRTTGGTSWVISNTANNYGGNTDISGGGKLKLGASGVIPDGSLVTMATPTRPPT